MSALDSDQIDFALPVPVFPLAECVLLPGVTVPLHIFESRYRVMTAESVESRRLISMACFEGDGWQKDYEGKPPICRTVCIGEITRCDRLDDGRYHLLLRGAARARIRREIPHDPYRIAELSPTEPRVMEIDVEPQRRALEEMLDDPVLSPMPVIGALNKPCRDEVPTPSLVDQVIFSLCADSGERFGMLEQPEVHERLAFAVERLRQTRQAIELAARTRPTAHGDDALSMN